MIWPFKKKPPPISLEEWAKQFPPAPCGEQRTHYEWVKLNGMACPRCHSNKHERIRVERMNELAEATAAAIVRQLQASGHPLK